MHWLDVLILAIYFTAVVAAGAVLSRRARRDMDSYFLGGRSIPWYLLGISNASGQFDITGTMWMVMLMFVYGVKSVWIPWVWPTFNQVFLMVFLAAWLRRSNVLTGTEWLRTRFGAGGGFELAHISVVLFALLSVVSFLAYAFVGIGKFAEAFLPFGVSPNVYALAIMSATACYVIAGGMFSVVLTDILQFALLSIAAVGVAIIAIANTTTEQIAAATPEGWSVLSFGWQLNLDWAERVEFASRQIADGGYGLFTAFVMMALFKGILASLAGPTPNYDMQRVLATRGPRESCLMSGIVSPVLYVPRYFLIAGIAVLGLVHFRTALNEMGDQADFEQVLPYVMQHFLPIGLKGVLLAGLFAAFMSTFDSTVNAGAAYLVNDVYKRYVNAGASSRHYMTASYLSSVLVVLVGFAVGVVISGPAGWEATADAATDGAVAAEPDGEPAAIETETLKSTTAGSIDEILQWITAGLYGGYVAPNVLKWIWWRLNGAGYFAGMLSGIALALASVRAEGVLGWISSRAPQLHPMFNGWIENSYVTPLNLFPAILILSGVTSVAVSYLTAPDDPQLLRRFYRQVRPWGFWSPIEQQVRTEDPSFSPNSDLGRDLANCAVGIVWQVALCLIPVYTVIRRFDALAGALVVAGATSLVLKLNWYDKLPAPGDGAQPFDAT